MLKVDARIDEFIVCDYIFGPAFPVVYRQGLTEFQAEHFRDLMDYDWKHRVTETERQP